MSFYNTYRHAVEATFPKLEPDFLLLGGLFTMSFFIVYVGMFFDFMLGALIGVLVLDFAIGFPMYKKQQRVNIIEKKLPDVFQHMATSLKAGSTIEGALQEVAMTNYGPITEEVKRMIKELKEGKTFEAAFLGMARRTESVPVMRSVRVIVSAKKSGGGVVQALNSIGDDMRETYRIQRERKAKTTIQVMFIGVAGTLISPFIFGLVTGIIGFLGGIGGQGAPAIFGTLIFYFKGFLVISSVFSAGVAAMMRDGDLSSMVVYAPIFLIITYTVFLLVSTLAVGFFGA